MGQNKKRSIGKKIDSFGASSKRFDTSSSKRKQRFAFYATIRRGTHNTRTQSAGVLRKCAVHCKALLFVKAGDASRTFETKNEKRQPKDEDGVIKEKGKKSRETR